MGVSMTFHSVGSNAIYQRKYAHGQTYGGLPCCICYCAVDYLTQHLEHFDYLAHVHIHTSTHKHTHKYTHNDTITLKHTQTSNTISIKYKHSKHPKPLIHTQNSQTHSLKQVQTTQVTLSQCHTTLPNTVTVG